jgi:asparagine synthase (glutamine-hydrolysing)
MGEILAHRGPDGSGTYLDGEIGLTNRRLRILDLSQAADQPMSTPDGSLWLTFNGEIHNYVELRRQLRSCGINFLTGTDTEVVLHAYARWGPDCFERFNGMWGLALWDARERRLVLSRDRFGIKPLYYSVRDDRVCFASEAKAILAAFPAEREPDRDEVQHFLAGGYPDSGESTFFQNIKVLAPARYLVFSATGASTSSYWRFRPGDEAPQPDAEERFRGLLTDSVRLRTRSDVPVGACISGGLDSSAIAALLGRGAPEATHCFSTRYDESGFDESPYAELATRGRGFTMHWVSPEPRDMLETIRKIVWHHDAPTPMRGRFAQWFVMQEVGRHVKVVLDGQGADELLAGYVRDTVCYLVERSRQERARPWRWRALAREFSALAQVEGSRRWYALMAPRRYLRDPRADRERPFASQLNNVLWNGLRHDGLPELLHSEDALSMAFSVESRTPFLDHRLVEFCFSLPFQEKIADGWTKSLLRRSMAGLVAPEILARRAKFGFGAPIVPWLQRRSNWRDVCALLLDPRSLDRGLFSPRRVEYELRAFRAGPGPYASMAVMRLWRWITLELWFRDFVDGAGTEPACLFRSRSGIPC